MCSKFCNNKENAHDNDADDEKWCIWYSSLKFIKQSKCENHSNDNNAHLTQTQVKNNGIFVFYLDRDLVLHTQIMPQICKKSKDYIIFL